MIPQSYNFNMYGNSWTGLLQTGVNMFNGMGNANFFTNCFGEVNYDKMAGFQVANALLGVGMQVVEAHQSQKEPEVNYTQELNTVAKDLKAKENELTDLNTDKVELENQKADFNRLQGELKAADDKYTKAESVYKEADAKNPKPTNLSELEKEMNNAKAEKTKIQEKIDKLKYKTEKEFEDAIEAKQKEIDKVQDEINDLESKQKRLQESADAKAIKEYKSCSWQRAEKGCLKEWANPRTDVYATKKELERASYEFRKAGSDEDRKKAGNAFINMYNSNDDFKDKYLPLYNAVKNWMDEHEDS